MEDDVSSCENNSGDLAQSDKTDIGENAAVTENTYSDGNISITITEYREYDTSIYVADITLTDEEYLKTAFAENTYGKNVTSKTSAIASETDAILAINGDFYGAQNSGYVIFNGKSIKERSVSDIVCIGY